MRHEHGYNNSVSTEYYNMEWRRPKLIFEASKGIEHGKVLFCEFGEHGAKFDTFKWQQEFSLDAEKITISINDLNNDIEGQRFNIKISISKT